jgi:hypothetical protein
VEDTRDKGEGPINYISPAEGARRAAWVGPVTDAEALRRGIAQYGTLTTNEGKSHVVLPGLHFKYEPFTNLVARASWSTGVGRPAFGSVIPNETVNDTAMTVTLSNPGVGPYSWTATPSTSWIKVSPTSGTRAVGTSQPLAIWVDLSGLAPGTSPLSEVIPPGFAQTFPGPPDVPKSFTITLTAGQQATGFIFLNKC